MTKARFVAYLLMPAWALALLLPAAAPAAQDFFLHIEGIPGESTDAKQKDAIDVESFSWGVTAGKTRASFQDFAFTKRVDRASPQLFLRAASGEAIPSAVLIVRKAGANQAEYLRYCMTDVRVTGVSTGGSGNADVVTENVSLSYGTFVQSYRRQNADGSLGSPFTGGWDLVRNLQIGAPTC